MKNCANTRASNEMSTQSATDFEWSVKCIGSAFRVGIASQLKSQSDFIFEYDENSILYFTNQGSPVIRNGSAVIHSNLPTWTNGDVIGFRFLPQTKKLVIDLVRIIVRNFANQDSTK